MSPPWRWPTLAVAPSRHGPAARLRRSSPRAACARSPTTTTTATRRPGVPGPARGLAALGRAGRQATPAGIADRCRALEARFGPGCRFRADYTPGALQSVACAAVWWTGSGWSSVCHDRFYEDLAAKRLVYLSPERNEDAGGSLLRLLKFHRRGYSAPLWSVGAVVARMLGGVDKDSGMMHGTEGQRAAVITGLLREVDPLRAMD